jgi:multidrug efflux pump
VGLLVDGAIVIVEYADRKMTEGLDRKAAYVLAAQRMSWPTISSTATTIAAFSPILFWPGISGQMMSHIPFTLNIVLVASLFMALVFIPTVGSLVARPKKDDHAGYVNQPDNEPLAIDRLPLMTRYYARFLSHALRHPGKVVLGTIALLFITVGLYGVSGNGVLFSPKSDPLRFYLLVHAPGNMSVIEKDKVLSEVEKLVVDIDDFKNFYTRTRTANDPYPDDVIGRLALNLKDWRKRRESKTTYDELEKRIANVPGLYIELAEDGSAMSQGKPVAIEFTGVDLAAIEEALVHVRRGIEEIGGFKNVEDSRAVPGIEWRLIVDRAEAARYGTDSSSPAAKPVDEQFTMTFWASTAVTLQVAFLPLSETPTSSPAL